MPWATLILGLCFKHENEINNDDIEIISKYIFFAIFANKQVELRHPLDIQW